MDSSRAPAIGILGVTPEGAAMAYRALVLGFYRRFGDYQSPAIHLYTQPLIDHVESFGQEDRWTALIQEGVDRLVAAGASVLWMPANSSHLAVERLNFGGACFVNMVEHAVEALKAKTEKHLLLGTKISMSDKLYFHDPAMRQRHARLAEAEQTAINDIILKELLVGHLSPHSRERVIHIVRDFCDREGIGRVFLACTELPCFFTADDFGRPVTHAVTPSIEKILTLYKG